MLVHSIVMRHDPRLRGKQLKQTIEDKARLRVGRGKKRKKTTIIHIVQVILDKVS